MASTLAGWWRRLEPAFPPGGPRRHLQDVHGHDLIAALERAGVLKPHGVAGHYPCPRRSSSGCPRRLVEIDGAWHAVCGNASVECEDLILDPADVLMLKLDPIRLCHAVAAALRIRAAPEDVTGMAGVFRVGTFVPDPGVRHPVYLVVRGGPRGYTEAVEALRSRQDGVPFAVLAPSDRFLSDEFQRVTRAGGVTMLVLADVIGLEAGRLVPLADPLRLFDGLGRKPAALGQPAGIVARALVREAGRPHQWFELDLRHYDELLAAAGRYDVFADERDRSVRKKDGGHLQDVLESYFSTIRAAVGCAGHYDPIVAGPDRLSGKQTFQRARPVFDLKAGRSSWRIFKSVRTDEGHTVYRFAPDPDVSFVFILLPEP